MIIFLTFDTKEECDKFIYLYSHYLNTVYYTVTRFVSEPYTIEDLSQDVFLALSKHLDKCDLSNEYSGLKRPDCRGSSTIVPQQ